MISGGKRWTLRSVAVSGAIPLLWMTIAVIDRGSSPTVKRNGFLLFGVSLLCLSLMQQPVVRRVARHAVMMLAVLFCYVAGSDWSVSIDLDSRGELLFAPARLILGVGVVLGIFMFRRSSSGALWRGAIRPALLLGVTLAAIAAVASFVLRLAYPVDSAQMFHDLARIVLEFALVLVLAVWSVSSVGASAIPARALGLACTATATILLVRGSL